VKITFDPAKRQAALGERGLDFVDAAMVFAGPTITVQDTRREYGEARYHRRISCRSNGDGGLDAARRGAAYYLDEKAQ